MFHVERHSQIGHHSQNCSTWNMVIELAFHSAPKSVPVSGPVYPSYAFAARPLTRGYYPVIPTGEQNGRFVGTLPS